MTLPSTEPTRDPGNDLYRLGPNEAGTDVAVAVAIVEGQSYAFQDGCTHQQCSLSEGFLDEYAIICPCHQSVFDVRDGQVLLGPATVPLTTFHCSTDGRSVSIGAPRPRLR
jgi:nitrite reductase/ring-hydroxylating ferredoxin subunit